MAELDLNKLHQTKYSELRKDVKKKLCKLFTERYLSRVFVRLAYDEITLEEAMTHLNDKALKLASKIK